MKRVHVEQGLNNDGVSRGFDRGIDISLLSSELKAPKSQVIADGRTGQRTGIE